MGKKLVIAILALFMAGIAFAQVSPSAKLEGKVVDDQGAPLPGVSIEATSPKMVGKATAVSDAGGSFRLFSLPSGTYEIIFTLQGFQTLVRKDIVIQLSQTINMNVTLSQAAIEEQVTVIGQSPLIDVKSTVKGQTMTKEVFMSLPRSRNFDGLLSTVPGVQNESIAGGLSVDGATGTENMWYMDGTDITQVHTGIRAQGAVMELIEEVKVTASGYSAEFGGSRGGVVNVITRSGGNAFHGDFVSYYEDNGMLMEGKARDYLRQDPYNDRLFEYVNNDDILYKGGLNRDDYKRYEGVFNLGGYIVKDMLWFFGSFNPQYNRTYADRSFLSDGATAPLFNFYRKNFAYNGQFKLTASPFKGMRMSASFVNNFSKYRGTIPSIYGTSSKAYDWKKEGYDYPNYSGAFMFDYSASNNFLISGRVGLSNQNITNQQINVPGTTYYFNYSNYIYETDAFFVANPSLLGFAGTNNGSTWQEYKRWKQGKIASNLDFTYYLSLGGEHAWKAGAQLIRDQEDVFRGAPYPRITLNWGTGYYGLASGEPVMGTYGHYQIRSGFTSPYGWVWKIHRNSIALYLQDSWTIGGRLTLNAGVRTESEYIPAFTADTQLEGYQSKPIQFGFGDKLAPRLGLVYDVFGDSTLKVFGSFGIYYDVMKLYMAEGAFGGFKWKTDYYELNNPDYRLIAASGLLDDAASQEAGGTYVGTMNWRLPSWDTTDPSMKPVSQREISFGAEKKLTEDLSLSVRLVQKHLIRTIEDIGVLTAEGEMYFNANPGFGWSLPVSQGGRFVDGLWPTPKATREYAAMNLSLEKRFSHNWQGGINYTLSKVAGNYGGLSSTDENGRNSPNVERYFDLWFLAYDLQGNELTGVLPQNRTHYFKAYGSYAFPFGLTVGIVGYGRSGLPLTTNLSANNVGIYPNNRADLGTLPFTMWADLYAEYALRISGRYSVAINIQVNNVTNTKTWQAKNTTVNRIGMPISDAQILSETFDWQGALPSYWPNEAFGMFTSQYGTWSTRIGARFSF
ncbi:MAG: carboxypeptidase regulatory-like domain-containing protein [Candidatus Aminicenantes bacterium]|nr:carboxypeptidase regulatory-like domain-containing protein [Candidatus Aminicenantes bacterium]